MTEAAASIDQENKRERERKCEIEREEVNPLKEAAGSVVVILMNMSRI